GVLPLQPQDPQVLLGAQQLEGLVLVVGGQDHLGEDRLHLLGHREGDGTVGGDDAAVGGDRVGAVGALVGEGDVLVLAGHGHAAGVVVLDHGDGREGVVVGGAHGGVGVDVVVVAHLLAAELLGAGEAGGGLVGDGQAGPLVRVLAVAEGGGDAELGGVGVGEVQDADLRVVLGLFVLRLGDVVGLVEPAEHPVADRVVVLGGAGEGDGRQL